MQEPETFEIRLRILGNEVVAFSLSSESPRKNWVVIGMIVAVLVAALANQLVPLIEVLQG